MEVIRPQCPHSMRFQVLWGAPLRPVLSSSCSVFFVGFFSFFIFFFLRRDRASLVVSSFNVLPWPGIMMWPQQPHTCCFCSSDCGKSCWNIRAFRWVMRCADIAGAVVASRCDASVRKPRLSGSVSVAMVESGPCSGQLCYRRAASGYEVEFADYRLFVGITGTRQVPR